MKISVQCQPAYSRGELLMRTFLGIFYIQIPHGFLLFFMTIWGAILSFLAWWVVLFTGSYPESWFGYQVKLLQWNLRLSARMGNLVDGYPEFGLAGGDDKTSLEVPQPESLNRLTLILRTLFGVVYAGIPHGFILLFRLLWGAILAFLAWWVILFTGSYPESWHCFQVENIRWITRLQLYFAYMTDEYPPFNGRE
jgi:hypothetical protein